jgi:hypothetical protein
MNAKYGLDIPPDHESLIEAFSQHINELGKSSSEVDGDLQEGIGLLYYSAVN